MIPVSVTVGRVLGTSSRRHFVPGAIEAVPTVSRETPTSIATTGCGVRLSTSAGDTFTIEPRSAVNCPRCRDLLDPKQTTIDTTTKGTRP